MAYVLTLLLVIGGTEQTPRTVTAITRSLVAKSPGQPAAQLSFVTCGDQVDLEAEDEVHGTCGVTSSFGQPAPALHFILGLPPTDCVHVQGFCVCTAGIDHSFVKRV